MERRFNKRGLRIVELHEVYEGPPSMTRFTNEQLRKLRNSVSDEYGSSNEPVNSLASELQEALHDLEILWHAFQTDTRPPAALQERLRRRFDR